MAIILVTSDRLQQVAFENPGSEIHPGKRSMKLVVGNLTYVAPLASEQAPA